MALALARYLQYSLLLLRYAKGVLTRLRAHGIGGQHIPALTLETSDSWGGMHITLALTSLPKQWMVRS